MKARQKRISMSLLPTLSLCASQEISPSAKKPSLALTSMTAMCASCAVLKDTLNQAILSKLILAIRLKLPENHPFLHELNRTDYLPELCQHCPVLDTCRGGCRAMALRAHGTAMAADPLFSMATAQKAQPKPYLKHLRP